MLYKDPRIPQARKVATALFNKAFLSCSNTFNDMMISDDNNLVIINEQTLIYSIPLLGEQLLPAINLQLNLNVNPFVDSNGEVRKDDGDEYMSDIHLLKTMNDCYQYYLGAENNNSLLCEEDELQGNEEFAKLLAMKKAQGLKFYKMFGTDMKEYLVPIFTGFPKMNKSDKINIKIFNLSNEHQLVVFYIFKKKINRWYKMYFRTITINNY